MHCSTVRGNSDIGARIPARAGGGHSERVQTVSMTWQHAAELAGTLAVAAAALRAVPHRWFRWTAPFALEAAILALLYSVWQLAGTVSITGTADAYRRAVWIAHFERDVGLPSERTMQDLILGHPLLVQAANLYYATMHFPMLFAFLIWLFLRHRDRYRPIRTTLAWTTLLCLLVQLMPVAPPRMLAGYVDTAMVYHQSVYQLGIPADQLSAMPSVHVAWAVLIGWYVWRVSPSRWHWIGAVHAVLTVFVVVATANHWWLDGIVATVLLAGCAWARFGVAAGWHALRRTPAQPTALPGGDEVAQPALS
jgi:hypothetical protein